jgi:hypothetical protein
VSFKQLLEGVKKKQELLTKSRAGKPADEPGKRILEKKFVITRCSDRS